MEDLDRVRASNSVMVEKMSLAKKGQRHGQGRILVSASSVFVLAILSLTYNSVIFVETR